MRAAAAVLIASLATPAAAAGVASYLVEGDAIPAPLTAEPGDPARGAALVRDRETANCLICHAIPDPAERFQGEVGPPLGGVGARLSPAQIRLRVVDPTLWNPAAVMPAYHRDAGLHLVDPRFAGRPVLSAQDVEDVVAYLATLQE